MNQESEGSVATFFFSCRSETGNNERNVMYLWEVNIDTAPAQKMTGLRSRGVGWGDARLSTWLLSSSNTVLSLKAPGHRHHFYKEPCWRCFGVLWGSRNVPLILELVTNSHTKVSKQDLSQQQISAILALRAIFNYLLLFLVGYKCLNQKNETIRVAN